MATPRVGYYSPHVPAEWIAAHGCAPCRFTPATSMTTTYAGMGVCPYAAAAIDDAAQWRDVAGMVLTTSCDQMRRQAELLEAVAPFSVFLLHVPTAISAPTAQPLYREELLRLSLFLERLGGVKPDAARLIETMTRFESARKRLRTRYQALGGACFSAAWTRFQQGDWSVVDAPVPETAPPSGTPLALVGGPLRASDMCLFAEIEAAGGWVALDATTTGERSLPPTFVPEALRVQPLDALLDAYLGIPDAFQRPNTGLYRYLHTAFQARGVRGIILRHYIWCDTWQMEAARLADTTALPLLRLDVGEEDDSARQAGRIQAFLETMQ